MIPLYKPYIPELPKLHEVLNSGKLTYGELSKKFENSIKAYLGTNNQALVTNCFLTAIYVVLRSLNLKLGDEVITSPMACLVSTEPLLTYGLKVVWADIDPLTGTLNPESVKAKITNKTKIIMHNHYCGYLGYIDEINAIGKAYGITVIDDCTEAFGSIYKTNKLGNCGTDVTIFNFSASRILNTIEGGCVLFNDEKLYPKARLISDSGIDRYNFRDEFGEISPVCDINLLGYNANLNNVNSYIGIEQLKNIDERLLKQRENANSWKNYCKNKGLRYINERNTSPNYWVFGLLPNNKDLVFSKFREKYFWASSVHINNNIYSIFGKEDTLPGVKEFIEHFISIPCGWWVSKKDIECLEV